MWRAGALAICLTGVIRLLLGEYHYSAGMAAPTVQESIDHLTAAGEAYPWHFRFRTAQAMQLFALLDRIPELAAPATISLALALAVDPGSAEQASKLLIAQRLRGDCDGAMATAAHLRRLAPRSEKAQRLLKSGCE